MCSTNLWFQLIYGIYSIKEARYSFFIPRVMILKIILKIHPNANVQFLPNFTIIITYAHSLLFYWFPSNRGYHDSNCYNALLFLIYPDFLKIYM